MNKRVLAVAIKVHMANTVNELTNQGERDSVSLTTIEKVLDSLMAIIGLPQLQEHIDLRVNRGNHDHEDPRRERSRGHGIYNREFAHSIEGNGFPQWMQPFSKVDMRGNPTVFSSRF